MDDWRAGDRAAGERLFDRYYGPIARFFLNKAGDAEQTSLGHCAKNASMKGPSRPDRCASRSTYMVLIDRRAFGRHPPASELLVRASFDNHPTMQIAKLTTQAVKQSTTTTKASSASQGLAVRSAIKAGGIAYENPHR